MTDAESNRPDEPSLERANDIPGNTPADVDAEVEGLASEEPSEPIVSVRHLLKDYGDTAAVRDISFDVRRGEVFGFIGPNGAGKTTTLRILSTLLEPTGGEVIVNGHCIENDTELVRQSIGYMPDHFGVYDGNTVSEYLEFFAGAYEIPRHQRRAIVDDVMHLTDLHDMRDRIVSALSKGMKQRLCLAKTLVHDPEVLILDEPASALDPRARIEFRALLKELRDMGKTIIISSHILTELSDICDSVAIIEQGRLVDSGEISELQRKSQGLDRVKIELLEITPRVVDVLGQHPQVVGLNIADKEIIFDYSGAAHEFYAVVKLLTDNAVPFLSIEYNPRNLESLFLELTKGDVQ